MPTNVDLARGTSKGGTHLDNHLTKLLPSIKSQLRMILTPRNSHPHFARFLPTLSPNLSSPTEKTHGRIRLNRVGHPRAAARRQPLRQVPLRTTPTLNANPSESVGVKCGRETQLLSGALAGGFDQGLKDSLLDPAGTIARLGTAGLLGFGLTALSNNPGFSAVIARGIGVGLTGAFIADLYDTQRLRTISGAINEAWQSADNMPYAKEKMTGSLGRFVFDTTLMSLADGMGAEGTLLSGRLPARALRVGTPLEVIDGSITHRFGNDILMLSNKTNGATLQLPDNLSWKWDTHPAYETRSTPDGTRITHFHDSGFDSILTTREGLTRFEATNANQKLHSLTIDDPDFHVKEVDSHIKDLNLRNWYRTTDLKSGLSITQFHNGDIHLIHPSNPPLALSADGHITTLSAPLPSPGLNEIRPDVASALASPTARETQPVLSSSSTLPITEARIGQSTPPPPSLSNKSHRQLLKFSPVSKSNSHLRAKCCSKTNSASSTTPATFLDSPNFDRF